MLNAVIAVDKLQLFKIVFIMRFETEIIVTNYINLVYFSAI